MNAYELADDLQECIDDGSTDLACVQEAAILIRQQADRIAELEKEVIRLVGAEPITYGTFTVCKNCGQQNPYTQTKPLSDEEIDEVLESLDVYIDTHAGVKLFAKAIEERHGIK